MRPPCHTCNAFGTVLPLYHRTCGGAGYSTRASAGTAFTGQSFGDCHKNASQGMSLSRDVRCAARVVQPPAPVLIAQPSTPLFDIPSEKFPLVRDLSTPAQWAIDRILEDIVLPVAIAFALVKVMDLLANSAAKLTHSEAGGSAAVLGEVLGLAPLALKGPSQFAVVVVLATRIIRNGLWILDSYMKKFSPELSGTTDRLFHAATGLLGPLDNGLVHLYTAVLMALTIVAAIRWKSIALDWFIKHNSTAKDMPMPMQEEDVQRIVLPLDSILSWVMSAVGGLSILQVLGLNLQPLWAVGGAGSIIVGLATQTLLTNSLMGFNFFLSRPFVPGDSIQLQGPSNLNVSGTVERVAPMRTMLRTDDDTLISIPNKMVADLIIHNRTRTSTSNGRRLPSRTPLKLRLRVPHNKLPDFPELRQQLVEVMDNSPTIIQQQDSMVLGKFMDTGVEFVVKAALIGDPSSSSSQEALLKMQQVAIQAGANLVSV